MRTMRTRLGGAAALVAAWLFAASAAADEVGGGEIRLSEPEAPATAPADPSAFVPAAVEPGYRDASIAIDDWNSRRPWRYSTEYLMQLSRGMEEAGIPRTARWPLYVLTVPADLALLPVGAIAGLFGS